MQKGLATQQPMSAHERFAQPVRIVFVQISAHAKNAKRKPFSLLLIDDLLSWQSVYGITDA